MIPLRSLSTRLRKILFRDQAERRMEEEFAFHLDLQTEKYIKRGMAPDDARRQALIDFGGVERHREAVRDARRPRVMAELAQDARYAVRSLRHNRSFAVTTVLIIALGVGVTTALFSVANALLFRDLPVAEPGELYALQEVRRGSSSIGPEGRRISYRRYEQYREATQDLFSGLAAHVFLPMSMRADEGAIPLQGALTSGNYFNVLGIAPAAGRFYTDDHEPVAVISHRTWRKHFNEDPGVIGRVVHIDGRPYTIAGIAPEGFEGTVVAMTINAWVPYLTHIATPDSAEGTPWVGMLGRVRDASLVAGAATRLSTIATRMPPETDQTTVERAYLAPLTGLPEEARAPASAFVGMLVAAGLLVLLIGAANIAAMLLARSVSRRREVAMRLALGAGRGRLIRQHLTESTLLFLLGGAGGIALAQIAATFISRISIQGVPVAIDASLDLRVLAFALGIAAFTGLVFGLTPALRSVRLDVAGSLKDGALSGATARMRSRGVFVGVQIAFAMLLLITAGLFVRGLQRGLSIDPGLDPDGVVIGTINLEPHGIDEQEGRVLQAELLRRVRALPGVTDASLARIALLIGSSHSNDVSTLPPDTVQLTSGMNYVDTAFFSTMRIGLVMGRGFTSADTRGSPGVVIINETLARRLWPGRNPLGQRLRRGEEYEVIGVAKDGKYVSLGESQRPFMFFPAAQHYSPAMTLHVRTRGNEAQVIQAVRQELRAVHPDVALELAMPLPEMIGFTLLPQKLGAGLIGAFGVLGLILATAGIYGVMSYQVAQRTREFGIRMALGARAKDVARTVLRRGVLLSIGGVLVGITMAFAVTRLLSGLLFGLSPLDPMTYAAVAAILVAAALLASWIPARRAFRVDPTISLRAE